MFSDIQEPYSTIIQLIVAAFMGYLLSFLIRLLYFIFDNF